jgi:hypothetical protein
MHELFHFSQQWIYVMDSPIHLQPRKIANNETHAPSRSIEKSFHLPKKLT